MAHLILTLLSFIFGAVATHYRLKTVGSKGFMAFITLCFGTAIFTVIMLVTFFAPMFISYIYAALVIFFTFGIISDYQKRLAK